MPATPASTARSFFKSFEEPYTLLGCEEGAHTEHRSQLFFAQVCSQAANRLDLCHHRIFVGLFLFQERAHGPISFTKSASKAAFFSA
jgi:hypothetical protein